MPQGPSQPRILPQVHLLSQLNVRVRDQIAEQISIRLLDLTDPSRSAASLQRILRCR